MPNKVRDFMKRQFSVRRQYYVARDLKRALWRADLFNRRSFRSLKPKTPSKGDVLLSYIIHPFLLKPGEPIPHHHTNVWESWQMAQTFLELGYSVDIIDWSLYETETFVPKKDYKVVIDSRGLLQRIAPFLSKDCVKIFHIDVPHILYQNMAESARLHALQQRKGVTLRPRRFEVPNLGIEHADCATTYGNEFTLSTFRYAKKAIYRLPHPAAAVYPWPEQKDFEACRKRFLWFGSGGLVRKGLDLVLEAFAEMPDCELVVCGTVREDSDFEAAYSKELYCTPNIRTVGWVDITSPLFIEITNSCVGLIFASCCESRCGGVVTCLQAGMIPVISRETDVEVHDFGFILKSSSIADIKEAVQAVSSLPARELRARARRAWECAQANDTRENYAAEYRSVIRKILSMHGSRPAWTGVPEIGEATAETSGA